MYFSRGVKLRFYGIYQIGTPTNGVSQKLFGRPYTSFLEI